MLVGGGGVATGIVVAIIAAATPIDPFVFAVILFIVGPILGGLTLLGGGMAVAFYKALARLLPRIAIYLFVSFVIGGLIIVPWLHADLFRYMEGLLRNENVNGSAATPYGEKLLPGGGLTVDEIASALPAGWELAAYPLWPLQFSVVRDLLALAAVLGFINIIPLFGIWWERKVAGRIQSRLGPMRVGGWHGWAQSFADGLKLIFKEDFVPPQGDRALFRLAPYLAFVPAVCAFIALPFGTYWAFRNLDVALVFILAMLGIEVVGVIVAGWASNNKWSVYGAMREACQMVSYEIPMGMALLIPVMTAGTLNLIRIVDDHQTGGFWNWIAFANPFCFIAANVYYIASLASCKRAPFDLPESESELVAGFHTEYSGFRWSLFFFAEYAAMYVVAGLCVTLFLGGWLSPFPDHWRLAGDTLWQRAVNGVLHSGPLWFVFKSGLLFYVQLWIRWTLPRLRIDQVLYSCIQVILPLTMLVLLGNTFWLLLEDNLDWFRGVSIVFNVGLAAIGVIVFLVCIAAIAYGYTNRRRLVGNLVVDALPGA